MRWAQALLLLHGRRSLTDRGRVCHRVVTQRCPRAYAGAIRGERGATTPVWLSDLPVVSGASSWDTTAPITHSAAPITMHHGRPMVSIPTGSRNVPAAAPIRLNALAMPTPAARTSLGNPPIGIQALGL